MCEVCQLRGVSWARALSRDPLAPRVRRAAPRVMPCLSRDPATLELFPLFRTLAEQRQLETRGWQMCGSLHLEQ